MYEYIITMKNGKEFTVESDMTIDQLFCALLPSNKNSYNIQKFKLSNARDNFVGIIGNEISSIEFSAYLI